MDRRSQIPEQVSIHLRKHVIPSHWEGDLIKGKDNASAVGTLVELTNGYVMLIKMNGAVEGFSVALNRILLSLRKTMTYDQGKEMARHAEITQNTGLASTSVTPTVLGNEGPMRTSRA